MASTQLIIDDEYIEKLGDHFWSKIHTLQNMVNDYLAEMKNIRETSIMEGSIAEGLDSYVTYAEKLRDYLQDIPSDLRDLTGFYIQDIDEADSYLF